jgi:hypothetical protein
MLFCLKEFHTVSQFLQFSKRLEDLNWTIDKQLLKDRVTFYENVSLFIELKKEYIDKKISIFTLKDEEVITWLDTMLLLRRVMLVLFQRGMMHEEIKIIMEYPFVLGNQMRSDYLIVFKQSVVILEFGMFNQDEKRKEERYTKKVQENIGHRHLLANLTNIDIYTYVLMYRPEFDFVSHQILKEHYHHNQGVVDNLATFLEIVIKKQVNKDAYYQLKHLEMYR